MTVSAVRGIRDIQQRFGGAGRIDDPSRGIVRDGAGIDQQSDFRFCVGIGWCASVSLDDKFHVTAGQKNFLQIVQFVVGHRPDVGVIGVNFHVFRFHRRRGTAVVVEAFRVHDSAGRIYGRVLR